MKKKKIKINFSAGVKYKNIYYLSAIHMNALFMYDINRDKLTFVTSFRKETKKDYLYIKAFLYKEEAWFIPYKANYIAIVNLEKLTVEYMELIYSKKYCSLPIKYINFLHLKNNFLLLIPQEIDAAMVIDLKGKSAKAYYDIVQEKVTYPYHGAVFFDNNIYFFPWREENILVLNLLTDERCYLPWTQKKEAFGDVVYDKLSNHLIYAPARYNCILFANLYNKSNREIRFCDWRDCKYRTYYATENKKNIFFWGHEKDIILKVKKTDFSVKRYEVNQDSSGVFFFPIWSEDVEAIVFDGNCIIKYDENKDIFLKIYMYTFLDDFLKEIKKSGFCLNDVFEEYSESKFKENDIFILQQFINYLLDETTKKNQQGVSNAGNKIYSKLINVNYV